MAFVSEWMGHSSIELTVNQAQNASQKAVDSVVGFPVSIIDFKGLTGAGDGDRTRDVQLGKTTVDCKHRI
jgi:hypothetical protein